MAKFCTKCGNELNDSNFCEKCGAKNEDANTKWHTQRGGDIIDYIDFDDLSKIISQNLELFKDYIYSPEWANTIFNTLNKSRNVIMHSGELSKEDIERIGMNIRDWIRQVGN